MWRYASALPVADSSQVVSLGEGLTPLLSAQSLRSDLQIDVGSLWLKDETVNPTGSFKDRYISVAITRARELGASAIVCASSGNAGASAAAYAARAGLPALVLAPSQTPVEKLTQIAAYGAILIKIRGNYSDCYHIAKDVASNSNIANVTTTFINPYGTAGLSTVAYELFDQFDGEIPEFVIVPTGAGPLVKGIVQGFSDVAGRSPRIVAVQPSGCAPIVYAYDHGMTAVEAWSNPDTIATGISDPLIGYERDGSYTLRLIRETNGLAFAVSDEEIRSAMWLLAQKAGVLAEPTAAASIAAVSRLKDLVDREAHIVCLITGHGFKDFGILRQAPARSFQAHLDVTEAVSGIDNILEKMGYLK